METMKQTHPRLINFGQISMDDAMTKFRQLQTVEGLKPFGATFISPTGKFGFIGLETLGKLHDLRTILPTLGFELHVVTERPLALQSIQPINESQFGAFYTEMFRMFVAPFEGLTIEKLIAQFSHAKPIQKANGRLLIVNGAMPAMDLFSWMRPNTECLVLIRTEGKVYGFTNATDRILAEHVEPTTVPCAISGFQMFFFPRVTDTTQFERLVTMQEQHINELFPTPVQSVESRPTAQRELVTAGTPDMSSSL